MACPHVVSVRTNTFGTHLFTRIALKVSGLRRSSRRKAITLDRGVEARQIFIKLNIVFYCTLRYISRLEVTLRPYYVPLKIPRQLHRTRRLQIEDGARGIAKS